MLIYLAGKIDFAEGNKSWQSEIMHEIECGCTASHNFYNPAKAFSLTDKSPKNAVAIKFINDQAILASDIIVAYIDKTMSIGTIIELYENANEGISKKPLIILNASGKCSMYMQFLKADVIVNSVTELIEAINGFKLP